MKKKYNFKSARFINSKITAAISISLVLFLLGIIVLLPLLAQNSAKLLKENLSFDIVLDDNTNSKQIQNIKAFLESSSFVKSTTYISKEEAAKQLEADLGQNIDEFIGFNPLPALIRVFLESNYAQVDSLSNIETQIRNYAGNIVKEFEYRKELIQMVSENLQKVNWMISALAILLLFISVTLIANTIRLKLYSKRFLIRTMKLVGAKNSFIRKPFILSNIVTGIIAACVSTGLLIGMLHWLLQDTDYSELISWQELLYIFLIILLLGVFISVFATYQVINKYIRMDGDDLYYI